MNKWVIIEVIHGDIFVWRQMVVNNCQGNVYCFVQDVEVVKIPSIRCRALGKSFDDSRDTFITG